MLPFKKILCPTDFSDPSYLAIKTGAEIAQLNSSQLIVLHIVEPLPMLYTAHGPLDFNTAEVEAEKKAYVSEKLDDILKREIPAGVSAQVKLDVGDPAGGIVYAAAQEKIDLIIMATHGLSGWRRFLLGSVTEKVVRNADCPVLTIREPSGVEVITADVAAPEIDACRKAPEWAEHARLDDLDEACDDGRSGKI